MSKRIYEHVEISVDLGLVLAVDVDEEEQLLSVYGSGSKIILGKDAHPDFLNRWREYVGSEPDLDVAAKKLAATWMRARWNELVRECDALRRMLGPILRSFPGNDRDLEVNEARRKLADRGEVWWTQGTP